MFLSMFLLLILRLEKCVSHTGDNTTVYRTEAEVENKISGLSSDTTVGFQWTCPFSRKDHYLLFPDKYKKKNKKKKK